MFFVQKVFKFLKYRMFYITRAFINSTGKITEN